MSNQSLATFDQFKKYASSIEIRERFNDIVGKTSAGAYIQSVIIAVSSSNQLMACDPKSIMVSAVRAATLRLTVDPSMGHAYIIPFKGKATLVVGYKGYIQLMERTSKYRTINIGTVWEGQEIEIDPLSGLVLALRGYRAANAKALGRFFSWRMLNGFEKTVYMTTEEIHEHAKQHSPSYSFKDSLWQTNPGVMEKKTVVRQSVPYIYLDPNDLNRLSAIDESGEATYDENIPDPSRVTVPVERKMSQGEILNALGYDTPEDDGTPAQEPEPANDAERIRTALADKAAKITTCSPEQRKLLGLVLSQFYSGDDTRRHVVQAYLTGASSTKDMQPGYVVALLNWLDLKKDPGGAYRVSDQAVSELNSIYDAAIVSQGQMSLI